jgi:flagellar biosynthetic protein FliP
VWETVSALSVVLGGIIIVGAILRGLGLGNLPQGRSRMRVVETISLSGRQKVHVIEVRGESLLVGSTDQSINLLRELPAQPDEAPVDESESVHRGAELLDRMRSVARVSFVFVLVYFCLPEPAMAQEVIDLGPAKLSLALDEATSPGQISSTLQIVALLTLISVAPSMILMMTCYARILIVLSLLRQAMGTHQLPPRQILVSLSLFTTIFVMAPVGEAIYENALVPYTSEEIDIGEAATRAAIPVREYILTHTREKDLGLFFELADEEPPEAREDVSFRMLLPAYMISEIRTAFEIGFMIYLPFLIIDILVASMLISMGMMVLPPMMISLPFKLMLFVLLDGWNLLISALVTGLQ